MFDKNQQSGDELDRSEKSLQTGQSFHPLDLSGSSFYIDTDGNGFECISTTSTAPSTPDHSQRTSGKDSFADECSSGYSVPHNRPDLPHYRSDSFSTFRDEHSRHSRGSSTTGQYCLAKFLSQRKKWSVIIVLASLFVTGVTMIAWYLSPKQSSSVPDNYIAAPTPLNLSPEFVACLKSVIPTENITVEAATKYASLNQTLMDGGIIQYPPDAEGAQSCSHHNLALWWLVVDQLRQQEAVEEEVTSKPLYELEVRYLMTYLFLELSGYHWYRSDNWLSQESVCSWEGLRCGSDEEDETRLMLELHLPHNALSGTLPSEVTLLPNLLVLNLTQNDISGTLPTEMFSIQSILPLDPFMRPSALLRSVDLSHNPNLRGSIPTELGLLDRLEVLNLESCDLTGRIPTEVGHLTDLESLQLAHNDLEGPIPTSLAAISKLKVLNVGDNHLSAGDVDVLLRNITGNGTHLDTLVLNTLNLTGSINGSSLANLTNLRVLVLGRNSISGSLPTEIGLLTSLETLEVGWNLLNGSIPSELGLCTRLQRLAMRENRLSGSVPSVLGNLTNLEDLVVYGNGDMEGTIPESLCRLVDSVLNAIDVGCGDGLRCSNSTPDCCANTCE